MDLVKCVLWHGEHAHIGPELLYQGLYDGLGAGGGRDANTLGGHLLARVLKVESHHPVELKLLEHTERNTLDSMINNNIIIQNDKF